MGFPGNDVIYNPEIPGLPQYDNMCSLQAKMFMYSHKFPFFLKSAHLAAIKVTVPWNVSSYLTGECEIVSTALHLLSKDHILKIPSRRFLQHPSIHGHTSIEGRLRSFEGRTGLFGSFLRRTPLHKSPVLPSKDTLLREPRPSFEGR